MEHKLNASSRKLTKRDSWHAIKNYLSGQSLETLIDLLLDVAKRDDRLFQALSLKVGRSAGEGNAIKAFRRAIDDVTSVEDMIDWREVSTYRAVLGKKGLHRYRQLAQAEWAKVEPRNTRGPFDYHRTKIMHIMEGLAQTADDVEELVAIKARDLTSGYDYLAIAEIWAKAKQPDTELDWAERGLKAFPDHVDNRLRDFAVAVYLKRKRNDEALQLTWVQFDERRWLAHFEKLHGVAGKLGVWPAQRDRALARIAQTIAREASKPNLWKLTLAPPNYSLPLEIARPHGEQECRAEMTRALTKVRDRARAISGGNWCFTISDNGVGIRPEDRQRIFGIFQRLHTPGEFKGAGIGLARRKQIVDWHCGEIGVDAVPAGG
jgi:hypothetical protein